MTGNIQQVVDIVLRGSVYKVACREGEGKRLEELAGRLSNRINAAVPGYERSKASDTLLLLLVGLQLEDRVEELETALKKAEDDLLACKNHCNKESAVIDALKNLLRNTITKTNELADSISVLGSD